MTRPSENNAAAAGAATGAPLYYLDANILLPEYLRAVFLDLADSGLVRVYWGTQVLAEVRRNLVSSKFGVSTKSADKVLSQMAKAFPDALVVHSEKLESMFQGKTDPKDAHVAAGALALSRSAGSNRQVTLVTSNTKHLPSSAFAGMPVRPVRPNTVLKELLAANPATADVLARMLQRFKAPRMDKEDLLMVLDASNCRGFATALAKAWGLDAEST